MSSALIIKGMAKLRGFWRESWVCLGLTARLAEARLPSVRKNARNGRKTSLFSSFSAQSDDFSDDFHLNRALFRHFKLRRPFENPSDSKNDSKRQNSHSPSHFDLKMTQSVTQNAKTVTFSVIYKKGCPAGQPPIQLFTSQTLMQPSRPHSCGNW